MITWATLRVQIGRKVNDPTATKPDLVQSVLDNFNDALRLFAAIHTGVASVSEILGDGETTQFPIPGNCVQSERAGIYAVYSETQARYLTETRFIPGDTQDEGYFVWTPGYIDFNPAPTINDVVTIYYVAHYDAVVDINSVVDVPEWALEALKLYTAGRVLEDTASRMAMSGNFKTKVDAGTPTDQPILDLSKRYIEQFWDIINSHPAPQYDRLRG